jgi:hypothetical protein
MGWNEVDNKHKKHKDGYFVSCEEPYELAYLKRIIKEEFPTLTDDLIDAALRHCCQSIPAPRARARFIACLMGQLGGE